MVPATGANVETSDPMGLFHILTTTVHMANSFSALVNSYLILYPFINWLFWAHLTQLFSGHIISPLLLLLLTKITTVIVTDETWALSWLTLFSAPFKPGIMPDTLQRPSCVMASLISLFVDEAIEAQRLSNLPFQYSQPPVAPTSMPHYLEHGAFSS